MKIKSKSQTTKLISILGSIALLVVTFIGGYLLIQRQQTIDDFNNPQIDNTVTDTNQPLIDKPLDNSAPPTEGKALIPTVPLNNSSDPSTEDQPEKPKITRSEQTQNGSIRISAIYTQPSDGTCKLILSKDSQVIEKSAPIIVGPSYYTCNGFLIPRDEIPESGEWTATITHQTKTKEIVSDSTHIQIQ